MAHQHQFLIHCFKMLANVCALAIAFTPHCECLFLLFPASEEEYPALGIFGNEFFNDLLHHPRWIHLALMGSKWRNAYPLLPVDMRTDDGWQQIEVSTLIGEDGLKLDVNGVSQLFQHLGIVLKRCRYLCQHLP